jgi:hypothetical protein
MTVAVTNFTTGPYTGNGATTAFPFTFKALSEAEVSVYVDDVAISSDLYAVTLSTSGGTVTFDTAPIADAVITIVSEPPSSLAPAMTTISAPMLPRAPAPASWASSLLRPGRRPAPYSPSCAM